MSELRAILERTAFDATYDDLDDIEKEVEALQLANKERWQIVSNKKLDAMKRMYCRTKPAENGCVEWTGPKNERGYGKSFYDDGVFKTYMSHRIFYYCLVGDIPEKMTIDHLCNNPLCQNVEHMILATLSDNMKRGSKPLDKIDHCIYGHKLEGDNLRMEWSGRKEKHTLTRKCVTCKNDSSRRYRLRKKVRIAELKKQLENIG